eukprot:gene28158-31807_t
MKTEKIVDEHEPDVPVHEESPKDIPQPTTEHIPVVEHLWSHNMHVSDPPQNHESKETNGLPLPKSTKRLHTIPSQVAHPPQPIHEAQEGRQEVRREPSKWELRGQSDGDLENINVLPSPQVSPRALWTNYAQQVPQKPPSYASNAGSDNRDTSHENNNGSGVSLELGIMRRNSRGRASSAPRERHSGASHTVPVHNVSFDPRAAYSPAPSYTPNGFHHAALSADRGHQHAHSPKLKHSRQEDFFGGRGPQSPPSHSPPAMHYQQRQHQHQFQHQHTQNGLRGVHGSYSSHASHSASRARGPRSPEMGYSHHESRAGAAGPYSSRANYPVHGAAPVLDLADAAEIARSTAFRLDSAYSAAQCLLSSISAEHAQGYLATGGRSIAQTPAPVVSGNPLELEKAHATISILSEMISSMEKSKESLAQLSSLHLHLQQQQQPPLISQREEHRRSSSAPRSRSSRKE